MINGNAGRFVFKKISVQQKIDVPLKGKVIFHLDISQDFEPSDEMDS